MSRKIIVDILALSRAETVYMRKWTATVNDILQEVIELNQLEDAAEYLGLTYVDRCGRCVWASVDSHIQDIDFHINHVQVFTLSVLKFPEDCDIEKMSHQATEIIFHYVSMCTSMHPLPVKSNHHLNNRLAAYKAKAYNVNVASLGFSLLAGLLPMKFATDKRSVVEAERRIRAHHGELRGQCELDAMVSHLKVAYACECFNQIFFTARRSESERPGQRRLCSETTMLEHSARGCKVLLGIGPKGVTEYCWSGSSREFTKGETICWDQISFSDDKKFQPFTINCADFEMRYLVHGKVKTKRYMCHRKDGEAIIELASSYLPGKVFKLPPGMPSVKGVAVWPFWEFNGKHHAPDCNCYLSNEEIIHLRKYHVSIAVTDVPISYGIYTRGAIETFKSELYKVYCTLFLTPKPITYYPRDMLLAPPATTTVPQRALQQHVFLSQDERVRHERLKTYVKNYQPVEPVVRNCVQLPFSGNNIPNALSNYAANYYVAASNQDPRYRAHNLNVVNRNGQLSHDRMLQLRSSPNICPDWSKHNRSLQAGNRANALLPIQGSRGHPVTCHWEDAGYNMQNWQLSPYENPQPHVKNEANSSQYLNHQLYGASHRSCAGRDNSNTSTGRTCNMEIRNEKKLIEHKKTAATCHLKEHKAPKENVWKRMKRLLLENLTN